MEKKALISFNHTWLEDDSNVLVFDDSDNDEGSPNTDHCNTESMNCNTNFKTQEIYDDEDHWSEDEAEIPAGITDTMLTAPDFVIDNERQYILNIAPGEGNRPVSIFRDKLAYPGIFIGQKHPDNNTRLRDVHYSEICKSELGKSDCRAAMWIDIFF
jgi:hypothetical protein